MQVILLENIHNVGNLGDTVQVKPGYARNYLIPKGMAAPATPENIQAFEARRAELERQQREAIAEAQARADVLNGLHVRIARRASDEGKLFGSVGTQDIADAVSEAGAEIQKQAVRLPEGPLRQVGEYEVDVQLYGEVTATVTVSVVPEQDMGSA